MIEYNNKIIAEGGHYVQDSEGRKGFSLPKGEEYSEYLIDISNVVKHPDGSYGIGGFNFKMKDNMKKFLVNKIFSNDDQIAIILNRESGESEDVAVFDLMQSWRSWFSQIIKLMEDADSTE